MIAAAEAAIDASAKDDQERARNRARLYAPPKGYGRPAAAGERPARAGMSLDQVQAMMASVAAEDAQLNGGRSG
ncbi:hypothetical protein ACWEFD_18210 [Streptomyces ardesiacus]